MLFMEMSPGRVAAILLVLVATLFATYRFVGTAEPDVAAEPRTSAKVKRVVSANKIKTESDEYVMLAGIRAPFRNEPFGEDAAALVSSLIEAKRVRIRFDERQKDKKERWVGYVFANGQMINERLVRDGLAYVRLSKSQDRYAQELLGAQAEARSEERGLWKTRDLRDGRTYVGDRKHGTFHTLECEDVPNIKPDDAVQLTGAETAFDEGFAPCGRCEP